MSSVSSSNDGSNNTNMLDLNKTLKEGERVIASTRRPDGTLRKPIRIRPGYTPPDEVPVYQSKGALWKKEMSSLLDVPPGYDPEAVETTKTKSKSAKRNERKKEKRHQAVNEKGKDLDQNDAVATDDSNEPPEKVTSITSKMNGLNLSGSASAVTPPSDSTSEDPIQDVEKKIRALKKKIRLTEAQQQKTTEKDMKPEQLEKLSKLEGWRNELKLLEDKKAEVTAQFS